MKYIFGPMKVPFLILTPMCILVGISTAMWSGPMLNATLHSAHRCRGGMLAHQRERP